MIGIAGAGSGRWRMAVTGATGVAEVLLLPLLLAVVGVVFIAIAVNDKGGARSDDGSRRLPTPRERPLYRLHMKIRASRKPPSASRASGPGVARFPRRRDAGGTRTAGSGHRSADAGSDGGAVSKASANPVMLESTTAPAHTGAAQASP